MSFIIVILFLLMPSYVSSAARTALLICIESVIPSLFPFMTAAKCAILTGDIKEDNFVFKLIAKIFNIPLSGVFAFVFGLVCGYPIGAKTAFDLLREGRIEKRDAIKLASFTNNAGPAFVIAVVGQGFLNSARAGLLIYISHITAGIITGILIRGKTKVFVSRPSEREQTPLTEAIPKAVYDSALGIINVTAIIMFFASFSAVLFNLLPQFVTDGDLKRGILSGIFEITSGISLIAKADINYLLKLSVITFLTGFSGVSIIFQTKSFAKGLNIKTTPCILCKVLSSIISVFILLFLYYCHSVFCK